MKFLGAYLRQTHPEAKQNRLAEHDLPRPARIPQGAGASGGEFGERMQGTHAKCGRTKQSRTVLLEPACRFQDTVPTVCFHKSCRSRHSTLVIHRAGLLWQEPDAPEYIMLTGNIFWNV